ncbi:DUF1328 domain-containing protein [Pseudoalteromonas sp. H105]|jgi:hypothetical protein|uniref:DUF1328 domain-containing protein n=1 Tax=Pseudoalteromonas sp. H105 TaxID=1348393 RepID=UPI0009E9EBF6
MIYNSVKLLASSNLYNVTNLGDDNVTLDYYYFLVIALITVMLGFGSIPDDIADIAKIVFLSFSFARYLTGFCCITRQPPQGIGNFKTK